MKKSVYEFTALKDDGSELALESLRGSVILVVNTASKCGFTPQYAGLEELHRKYAGRGLVVLGFPCDQFAHQEPGDAAEITSFCRRNFGVSFQLMAKVKVNGPGAHPLFAFLRGKTPGPFGNRIKWNFTKFLVSRDGLGIKRFSPSFEPSRMEADIENALRG